MSTLPSELSILLKKLGVNYVFGIPGGPSIPYMDEFRKNDIEFITVANEQSAAIMADVIGRLTGVPGVCHATFGPGATNLSTGVGEALLDRSPLIAFTSVFKDSDSNRVIQMNIDHQEVFKPVTKMTSRLSKDNFNSVMEKSIITAISEKPGSVHIGLPVDIVTDTVELNIDFDKLKFEIESPSKEILNNIKDSLQRFKNPIIAIGLTAARLGAGDQIKSFIDKNNIPFVVTPMAKGIISEDHPLFAGVLFHSKSDIVANIYRQADVIVGIGYDTIEFNYEDWMPNVPLINIDTENVDIRAEYTVLHESIGDISESIEYLNKFDYPKFDWDLSEISDNKDLLIKALTLETNTFSPSKAILALQELIPDNNIVTCDVGAHLHLMGQLWRTYGNKFLITNGWSAMGFGIPAAIGAKLASPSSTVVCVTGDGGFLMNCGDLIVARRMGINVVIIVLVDGDYSLIKVKQNWRNVDQYATFVHDDEYFKADYFLGIPILKANDENEMKLVLKQAFVTEGPVIIEANIDGSSYQDLITRNYK